MSQKKARSKDYEIKDHQLYFSRLRVLLQLFRENKVSPNKRWMRLRIFFFACLTQPFMFLQDLLYRKKLKRVDLQSKEKAPIFILGHYRSGTTHLHYLMAKDPQLGHVQNYHSFMVNFCLLGRNWLDRLLAPLVPSKRPMDNMKMDMFAPQEEDQSVGNISTHIGIHSYFFPKNRSYFEKYSLQKGLSSKEKKAWQKAYDKNLRIVSLGNDQKRLVIKNPANTGRIKALLELYPNAKFIYIHRNPYEVYRSTRKLYRKSIQTQFLQEVDEAHIQNMIINNYKDFIQYYLDQRHLLRPNQLIEISFEELTNDGEATIEKIYQQLDLEGWENAQPQVRDYLESVKNYKRNRFKGLPLKLTYRIQQEWGFAFEAWDYPLTYENYVAEFS